MKLIKNIAILCVVSLLMIGFLEVAIRYYYKNIRPLPNEAALVEYQNVAHLNHHIRQFYVDGVTLRNPKSYYFSEYGSGDTGSTILIQGDSWIEKLEIYADKIVYDKITSQNKIKRFINGGVSSYSPSPMEIQYKDVKTSLPDHKIDLVIAYIDQTDFMDEVCRYDKNRVQDSRGSLLALLKDDQVIGFTPLGYIEIVPLVDKVLSPSKLFALVNNLIQTKFVIPRRQKPLQSDCTFKN